MINLMLEICNSVTNNSGVRGVLVETIPNPKFGFNMGWLFKTTTSHLDIRIKTVLAKPMLDKCCTDRIRLYPLMFGSSNGGRKLTCATCLHLETSISNGTKCKSIEHIADIAKENKRLKYTIQYKKHLIAAIIVVKSILLSRGIEDVYSVGSLRTILKSLVCILEPKIPWDLII